MYKKKTPRHLTGLHIRPGGAWTLCRPHSSLHNNSTGTAFTVYQGPGEKICFKRCVTSQAEITLLVSLQYLLWHYEDVTLQRLAWRSLLHKYSHLWQFTATNNVSTWLRNKVYVRPPPLPHNSPAEYSFSTPAAQIVARQPFSAALYFQPPDVVEDGKQSTHLQSFKKHTYLSE